MNNLQDEVNVFTHKEPLNPVLEHIKQSSFQPDIQSYVTLDAKYYEDGQYSADLYAKFGNAEINIFLHHVHNQADEVRKYLLSLHQLSGDMLMFMKKHSIRTSVDGE